MFISCLERRNAFPSSHIRVQHIFFLSQGTDIGSHGAAMSAYLTTILASTNEKMEWKQIFDSTWKRGNVQRNETRSDQTNKTELQNENDHRE